MTEESSTVVRKMLDYLYTGDYSERLEELPTDGSAEAPPLPLSPLQLHAKVFALGDKYCVTDLCDASAAKYLKRIEDQFDPLEFLDSIPDVFYSPFNYDGALRELVLRFSRDNLEALRRNTNVRAKYDSVAAQAPEFVKEMLDTYLDAPLLGYCENCGCRRPMLPLQARCGKCHRGKGINCKASAY